MIRTMFVMAAAVVAMAFVGTSTANAQYWHHGYSHFNLHQDLGHNEFHRQQYHAYRHQFPQTRYQHFRLHQDLDHDRFHDGLRHQRYHHYRGYYPRHRSHFGLGIYGRGIYLRFGH